MKVLVTGGAGYIGSHTCVELLQRGDSVLVFDNLANSKFTALKRVAEITGKTPAFWHGDLLDYSAIEHAVKDFSPDAVIHFAGFKAVGESVKLPLRYHHNNLTGTLNLCHVMQAHACKNLVFSSSSTVYGNPASVPITEDFPLAALSPYGATKLFIEQILRDLHTADPAWNIALLRYFNPVGAHPSGRIGEDPQGLPNNLMPYITQVAVGKLTELSVFGNDYPTPDGTCIRDYLHVVDLARGHLCALNKLATRPGCRAWNLGTGVGYSVLDVINAFAQASGKKIPYRIVGRRAGDVTQCYADPTRAQQELAWQAQYDLPQMCADAWRWQEMNPQGYPD